MSRSGLAGRVDTEQFRVQFGKTSQLDAKLKRALRKKIKQAADVAAQDVRETVLQPPLSGGNGESTGLRQGIADGVKVSLLTGNKAGVVVRASTSGLPENQKTLVRGYGAKKGWRHPVFGTDTWVTQLGRPFFAPVIAAHKAEITAAVQQAMQDALDSLK